MRVRKIPSGKGLLLQGRAIRHGEAITHTWRARCKKGQVAKVLSGEKLIKNQRIAMK
jgi:hypothetical protein